LLVEVVEMVEICYRVAVVVDEVGEVVEGNSNKNPKQ
jgi:hypothetical protein